MPRSWSCFSLIFPTVKKQFSMKCLTAVFNEMFDRSFQWNLWLQFFNEMLGWSFSMKCLTPVFNEMFDSSFSMKCLTAVFNEMFDCSFQWNVWQRIYTYEISNSGNAPYILNKIPTHNLPAPRYRCYLLLILEIQFHIPIFHRGLR